MRGRLAREIGLITVIALTLPLFSFEATAKPSGTAWMVLYYGNGDVGDGDIEPCILHDLEEMKSASLNARIRVVAMIDRWSNWEDAANSNARYYSVYDGFAVLEKDCGELNMGDSTSLSDFVVWAKSNFKSATRYALIISDHGKGFRGVSFDYSSNSDCITMNELKTALTTIQSTTGIVFDVIGFDACVMSEIEVAYQIRSFAKVMVASEEFEYGWFENGVWMGGWPYDTILTDLANNYAADAAGFATMIVNRYGEFWGLRTPSLPGEDETMTAIYLQSVGGMTNLVNAIEEFAVGLRNRLSTYRTKIDVCRDLTDHFGSLLTFYYDLYDFVDKVDAANLAEDRNFRKAMSSIRMSIDSMIIAYYHEVGHQYSHGLSIFFPTRDIYASTLPQYGSLDFCASGAAPDWNNFLHDWNLGP